MKKANLLLALLALVLVMSLVTSVASAAPPAQEELTYTVKLGDNLWTLAEKYLGNGPAYWAIVDATNAKHAEDSSFAYIENPSLIHPGWKFVIPAVPAAAGELGSAERPIQVLFVPSVDVGAIVSGGEVMAKALEDATGLKFEVSVPTSYAATIEAMCASPEDTIGFIPALGYVLANQKCGVEVGGAAVRYGWSVYWAQFLVQRDSNYHTLKDLAGKKWAIPDLGSTSGYLFPSVMFQEAGVKPGEIVEAGGHPQAALAVYNGEVDFATTYFSAPLTDPAWQPGDDPEPYDPMEAAMDDSGKVYADGVRILDARIAVMETAPDIIQKVRIMMLTDPIPNDTMSFGPDFPDELKARVIDALIAFMATDACGESICSTDFYNWTGMDPVDDAAYDVIRRLIKGLGYTEEDIFGG